MTLQSNETMIYHLIINQARDSAQLVHHTPDLRHDFPFNHKSNI